MSTTVFVYTMNRVGAVGAWSRYVFPYAVDAFAQLGDDIYIRSGDDVLVVDENAVTDYAGDPREQVFTGLIQWPWLDFGAPGVTKQLVGFDIVGTGATNIQIGYDQSAKGTFTEPFLVPADTVPGMMIPLPVMAPSMSVRLTYTGGYKWQFNALNVTVSDMRLGA
ncbi:MAG: hypothetical protein AAGC76_09420 [Luteibacter sp.]|uniref:hypothetical protein n=1 Tax=Luteibacter sp. TaxID=1886636 RepID=UPI002807F7D7|nr:hypothetical protein [Luteibacter sp.]MDQ7996061.1 hypothetical protein [Luteibacter sp.]